MRITKYILKLALPLVLFLGGAIPAFPQGVRYDNILLGVGGGPRAGVTVAVCQPTGLATTAASVTGNVATLTMASNPSTLGFVVGGNISVTGFTGADTYFNGSFVLTAVSSTTLTFNLSHANASATSNGAVTQTVSAGATCAPWATIYTDDTLTIQMSQPFRVDGLGNYGFGAAPGKYIVSFNGAGINPTTNTLTLPCVPNSTCPLGSLSVSSLTVSGQITSTVATGTAPLSIASTTVVPNLNAQLHNGKTAPVGNIVGDTDTQTLTNKTLTSPAITNPSTTGTDSGTETLTGKTLDISANTLKTATNTAGHYPRNNGTQYVDATIASADLPATTSPCSGVQLAIGLNAGGTSNCATPPTFVASGASHAVGYVPDPGSSAGTTRFLREDATWQTAPGGVSEATWASSQPSAPGAGATAKAYAEMILPSAHTLVRFVGFVGAAITGCATTVPVVAFEDETSSTALSSLTLSNTGSQVYDSGVISVAMTAGHTFSVRITTAGDGACGAGSPATWTAVYK